MFSEYNHPSQRTRRLTLGVAVDLKVSQVVDVPNFTVSAFLPLDIFDH